MGNVVREVAFALGTYHRDEAAYLVPQARVVVQHLAEKGLIAPAPLTEEWHAAYYGVTRDGVRHLRLIGTEGSREHAEEARADCAQDDPDTEFFLVRRPVHDWMPVNRAKGDEWKKADNG